MYAPLSHLQRVSGLFFPKLLLEANSNLDRDPPHPVIHPAEKICRQSKEDAESNHVKNGISVSDECYVNRL